MAERISGFNPTAMLQQVEAFAQQAITGHLGANDISNFIHANNLTDPGQNIATQAMPFSSSGTPNSGFNSSQAGNSINDLMNQGKALAQSDNPDDMQKGTEMMQKAKRLFELQQQIQKMISEMALKAIDNMDVRAS